MTRDIAADSVQIGPLGPVSIHATIICTEVWFSRPTAQWWSSGPVSQTRFRSFNHVVKPFVFLDLHTKYVALLFCKKEKKFFFLAKEIDWIIILILFVNFKNPLEYMLLKFKVSLMKCQLKRLSVILLDDI